MRVGFGDGGEHQQRMGKGTNHAGGRVAMWVIWVHPLLFWGAGYMDDGILRPLVDAGCEIWKKDKMPEMSNQVSIGIWTNTVFL
jgi:hypothetical protein